MICTELRSLPEVTTGLQTYQQLINMFRSSKKTICFKLKPAGSELGVDPVLTAATSEIDVLMYLQRKGVRRVDAAQTSGIRLEGHARGCLRGDQHPV